MGGPPLRGGMRSELVSYHFELLWLTVLVELVW